MKALIRGESEVYLETEWSDYTRANLEWYHTKSPDGNGYALVEDFKDGSEPKDYVIAEVEMPEEDRVKILLVARIREGWTPSEEVTPSGSSE